MEETAFREKVRKQLWFLNKKEKQLLEHTFEQNNASFNNAEQKFMTPTRFANQFINPKAELSLIYLVLILVFAIISLIVSLYLIRFVTALFTKRLLEYKFNEKKSSY